MSPTGKSNNSNHHPNVAGRGETSQEEQSGCPEHNLQQPTGSYIEGFIGEIFQYWMYCDRLAPNWEVEVIQQPTESNQQVATSQEAQWRCPRHNYQQPTGCYLEGFLGEILHYWMYCDQLVPNWEVELIQQPTETKQQVASSEEAQSICLRHNPKQPNE